MKITLQMAPGYPAGILGRNGFRGGFPHAARRMLSYEETPSPDNTDLDFKTKQLNSFRGSQNLNKHPTKNSNALDNRKALVENINYLKNTSIRMSSHSTLAYSLRSESDPAKYHQNIPWQRRSLLWSPPQIISSVLKVFRKVLAYIIWFLKSFAKLKCKNSYKLYFIYSYLYKAM